MKRKTWARGRALALFVAAFGLGRTEAAVAQTVAPAPDTAPVTSPAVSPAPEAPPVLSPAPGGSPVVPPVNADDAEIARALEADQAARAASAGVSPAPAPGEAAAPVAAARGSQSLNPDISAIVDFAAGWFSDDAGTFKGGDDPQSTGFKVQEIELALQQVVDPYFRADLYLTIPNLSGLEVEEAFLTTTALPGNLQLKAGIFRAGLGRQNAQHLHVQDFSRRPALNAALLGVDGLRAPGLEANWLVPGIPFYLLLAGSAFSVDAAEADLPLQTFGGGGRTDLTYVGSARAFFPLGQATSVFLGVNYARGRTSQRSSYLTMLDGRTLLDGFVSNLYGADLYVKWKPANQAQTYASLAWQTEYFLREVADQVIVGARTPPLEGALYSQLVAQVERRWFVGLRGEILGLPSAYTMNREYAGALSLTWALSEFARVRVYGEIRDGRPFSPLALLPQPPNQSPDSFTYVLPGARWSEALFLQLEAAIGAHGAHPF